MKIHFQNTVNECINQINIFIEIEIHESKQTEIEVHCMSFYIYLEVENKVEIHNRLNRNIIEIEE